MIPCIRPTAIYVGRPHRQFRHRGFRNLGLSLTVALMGHIYKRERILKQLIRVSAGFYSVLIFVALGAATSHAEVVSNGHMEPAASAAERTLFIFKSGPNYYEVVTDSLTTAADRTALCGECDPYFMNFKLVKANEYTPVRTGQELVPQLAKNGTQYTAPTVSLLEGANFVGDQVSIYLCVRGKPPSKTSCAGVQSLMVRNLLTSQPFLKIDSLPSFGDLHTLVVRAGGRIDVTSGSERTAIIARAQNDAVLVEQQRRKIADQNAQVAAAAANEASVSNAASMSQLGQQPAGSTLFCGTDPHWPRSPGDAVDRQNLLCHLVGKQNMPPLAGAALLTSGWTIVSENRRTEHNTILSVDMGTVEVTEVTLRKTL
jgi:hypothetical protein